MAVVDDVATRFPTGTTSDVTAGTRTFSHAGSASTKGAVVIVQGTGTAAYVTGVLYGGVAMTLQATAIDTTEAGRVDIYVLTSGVPTGTQTVTLQGATTTAKFATAATVTAGALGVSVDASAVVNTTVGTAAGVTLSTRRAACSFAGIHHGAAAPSTTMVAGNTALFGMDYGALSGQTVRRTAVDAAGTFALGVTIVSDDFCAAGVAFAEVLPPAGTLTDDFTGALDTAKWPNSFGAANSNGRGTVPITNSYPGYYTAATAYSLIDSSITLEVLVVPNVGLGTTQGVLNFNAGNDGVELFWSNGSLTLRERVAGTDSDVSVTYDATAHRWWRMRHVSATNTLSWETSPDGSTWTVRRSKAPGFDLGSGSIHLKAGFYAVSESVPGTFEFDNFNVAPVSGVNGSGAPLLGTMSSAAAGTVAVSGSGTTSLGTLSSTSSGKVDIVGAGSATLATPVSTSAGGVEVRGSGVNLLAAVTASGVAKAEVKGTGTNALAAITASGAAKADIAATGSPSLAALSSTGAGTLPIAGSGSAPLASPTTVAAGQVAVTGSLSRTLATITATGAGTIGAVPISGAGSPVLGTPTSTSAGQVAVSGSGSGLLGTVAASGAAKAEVKGSGAGSLAALSSSSAGKVEVKGTGSPLLGTMTSTAVGQAAVSGSGTGSLGTLSSTASGQIAVQGSGSSTLATPSTSSAGRVDVAGSLAQPLTTVTSTGTGSIGSVPISGTGSPLLGTITAMGAAVADVRGTGSATFATASSSGAGKVAVSGTGSVGLGTLAGSGAAQVEVRGAGAPSFGTLSTASSATVAVAGTGTAVLPALSGSGTGTPATVVISGTGSPALFTALLGFGTGSITGIGSVVPRRVLVLGTTTAGRDLSTDERTAWQLSASGSTSLRDLDLTTTSGRRLETDDTSSRVLEVTNG